MATNKAKRGFAGLTKLRKTLRRLDPEVKSQVASAIETSGARLAARVTGNAPSLTGELRQQIGYKVSRDKLTVVAGVGAGNAHIQKSGFGGVVIKKTKSGAKTKVTIRNEKARWNLYKALWHEFGTKGGNGAPPQSASHFHQRAFDAEEGAIKSRVQGAVSKALQMAVNG